MSAFLFYVLKSSLVLTFLVPLFMAFMSRETFHRINRFVLLAIMLLAFVLPAVNLGVESPFARFVAIMQDSAVPTTAGTDVAPTEVLVGELDVAALGGATQVVSTASSGPFDWLLMAFVVYMSGVGVLLVRQVVVYMQMFRLLLASRAVDASHYGAQGIRLRVHSGKEKPFSWFRWVVLGEDDMQDGAREILTHGAAHVAAGHSWDIVFADAVIILQWFNPLAWIAKSVLKDIHEFEADEAVINSGVNAKQYQLLIIKKAVGARLYSIANSFNHSLTKKRITMMCKEKSKKWRCAKALYILPVAAVAALSFSTVENANAVETELASKVNEIAMNGASVSGEISAGTPVIPETAVAADTVVYQVCEQQPEFPGGGSAMVKFLAENIKYPADAMEAGKGGKVFVQFVVRRDGSVNDVVIMKSSGTPSLDNEALRVVKSMPKWKPGMQRGEAVNVRFMIPVAFAPQGKTTAPKKESVITLEGGGMMVKEPSDFAVVVNGAFYEGDLKDIDSNTIESVTVVPVDKLTGDHLNKCRQLGKKGVLFIAIKTEEPAKEAVFMVCEQQPEFPGGQQALMKFLQTNIRYPLAARNAQLQGKIYVQFVVKSDGTIVDVVVKKADYSFQGKLMQESTEELEKLFGEGSSVKRLDDVVVVTYANGEEERLDTAAPDKHPAAKFLAAEAVRVVSVMPNWTPGMQGGKPVNVQCMLPISFRLQ